MSFVCYTSFYFFLSAYGVHVHAYVCVFRCVFGYLCVRVKFWSQLTTDFYIFLSVYGVYVRVYMCVGGWGLCVRDCVGLLLIRVYAYNF